MVWVNFFDDIEGFGCNEHSLGFNVEQLIVQEEYAEGKKHECLFNKKNIQGNCFFDQRRFCQK